MDDLDFSAYAEKPAGDDEPLDFSAYAEKPAGDAPAPGPEKKPATHSAFARGAVSGLISQNPSTMADTFEGLSYKAGQGPVQDWMRQAATDLRGMKDLNPDEFKTKYQSFDDVHGVSDALSWLGEGVGQALASSVPTLIGTIGGGVIGGRVAGKPGAAVGMAGGALTGSYIMNYGEVYRAAVDEGIAPEKAADMAAYISVPISALDAYVPAKTIAQLGGLSAAKHAAIKGMIHRMAASGVESGLAEGATEAWQEALKDFGVASESGKDFLTAKNIQGIAESFLIGAGSGVVMGGIGGVRRNKPADEGGSDLPPGDTDTNTLPPIKVEQGAPETVNQAPGDGTTNNQPKPPVAPEVGNPKSAPTRSSREGRKAKPAKAAPAPVATNDVGEDQAAAIAASIPQETPQVQVQEPELDWQAPAPVAPEPVPSPAPEVTAEVTPQPVPEAAPAPVAPAPVAEEEPLDLTEEAPDFSAFAEPEKPKTPRILPDKTRYAEPQLTNQEAKANVKATTPKEVKKGNRSKIELAARAKENEIADAVVKDHEPGPAEEKFWSEKPAQAKVAQGAILARARQMVAKAKAAGLTKIPKVFADNVDESQNRNDAQLVLSEAQALLGVKKPRAEDFARFVERERTVRSGNAEAIAEMRAARRAEGESKKLVSKGNVEQLAAAPTAFTEEAAAENEAIASEIEPELPDADTKVAEVTDDEGNVSAEEATSELGESRGAASMSAQAADAQSRPASVVASSKGRARLNDRTEKKVLKTKDGKEVEEDVAQAASGEKLAADEKARLIAEMNARLAAGDKKVVSTEVTSKVTTPKPAKVEAVVEKAKAKAKPVPRVEETKSEPKKKRDELRREKLSKEASEHTGLPIKVEKPRGTVRTGVAENGEKWAVLTQDHEGEIERTKGADGERVDVTVGPHVKNNDTVFVIDQVNAETQAFDEHKVMVGFKDASRAADAYVRRFSDGKGKQRFGGIKAMSTDEFKTWLKNKDNPKAPVSDEVAGDAIQDSRDAPKGWDTPGVHEHARQPNETRDDYIKRTAIESTTAGKVWNQVYGTNSLLEAISARVPTPLRAVFQPMASHIMRLASDTPVHIVPDHVFKEVTKSPTALGMYYSGSNTILLPESVLSSDRAEHIILHEATHAAFVRATYDSPHVRKLVDRIAREAKEAGIGDQYAFSNIDEFIAEAFSNPKFIRWLASVKASPALSIGIAQDKRSAIGRPIKTLWDALLSTIGRALGFDGSLKYTLLDAMMHVGAELEQAALNNKNRTLSGIEGQLRNMDRVNLTQRPGSPWHAYNGPARADAAPGFVTDNKSAFDNWRKRVAVQLRTLDQLRQDYSESAFGEPLRKLVNAVAKTQPSIAKFKKSYEHIAQDLLDLADNKETARYADEMADILTELRMIEGTVVEGETPATINGHKANEHLGKDARRGWQARSRLPDLQRRYNALPANVRSQLQRLAVWYRETQGNALRASVINIVDGSGATMTPVERERVINHAMLEQLTPADVTLVGKTIAHALEKEVSANTVRGTYVPLMRFGDHVVETIDKIKDTMGGTLTSPNTVMFKNASKSAVEKAAKAFVQASPLRHESTRTVYFDGNTGDEITADEATGLNNVEYGVEVKMQTHGVYFFDSHQEAAAFKRTNPNGHDVVSEPQDRLTEGHAHTMTGTQVETLLRSINLRDDIGEGQKDQLRTIVSHGAIRLLQGNRITHRRLKAQKITGASKDLARSLLSYGEAAARHLAATETAAPVREAMADMRKVLSNYHGKDKPQLDQVYNNIKDRVKEGIIDPNEPSRFERNAMALTYFARLGSPAYSLINMMQVPMVTAPILNGRFHALRGTQAIARAYADIGLSENVISGLINTARAAGAIRKQGLNGLVDIVGRERDIIAKLKDGADLVRMFDELVDGNAISLTSGFEIGEADAYGRGVTGKVIARLDRIMRQLPAAVETINRTVTAIASYRLARESGMNHEKATQFAFDTTKNTQGDYSAGNAPRVFNNRYLRPALQFKKYAQLITYLLADATHRAFHHASREERVIARKQLAQIMATQIAIAGALSLPGLEIAKLAFMLTAACSLTGSWDDQEEYLRQLADDTFGKAWGELVTRGVISRAVGLDVSSRLSLNDMWLFGEPRDQDTDGVLAYIARQTYGAPGSYAIVDLGQGAALLASGQWGKALGKMIPIKTISDSIKAVTSDNGAEGAVEFVTNAVGFKTARQAEEQRKVGKSVRASKAQENAYKELSRAYREAETPGERAVLRTKIIAHNKSVSSFRYKVPYQSIDKHRNNED